MPASAVALCSRFSLEVDGRVKRTAYAHMSSAGECNLEVLLAGLSPSLVPGEFIVCSQSDSDITHDLDDTAAVSAVFLEMEPLAIIREREGFTLVLPVEHARALNLDCTLPMRCITLNVHSSLEAVGLTAAVATALAQESISANMLAGFYHDHVLVPAADAGRALDVLECLSQRNSGGS